MTSEVDPIDARSLTAEALRRWVEAQQLPTYRADQLFGWLHQHAATDVDQMSNLPAALRESWRDLLKLVPLSVDVTQASIDGTKKMRLRTEAGDVLESVLIPQDRPSRDGQPTTYTQCISSQVGCAMGCRFCATATMGMRKNLSAGEIVDQVYRARCQLGPGETVANLVFMGMGEPLANLDSVLDAIEILCDSKGADFSPRRITVSTVGLLPKIAELGRRNPKVGLAISLHATTDQVRDSLIPLNQRYNIAALMGALRSYPLPKRRRITFEYIVLDGLNDTAADAQRLAKLASQVPSKVNLLAYNPCRGDQADLRRPSDTVVEQFAETLRHHGINATVRRSRGLDIDAACGQLALRAASGAQVES